MHQILGLRSFVSPSDGKEITYDAFHEKNWRAKSLKHLFMNLDDYLKEIPEKDHWNLFYTVALCSENKREFASQNVLVFDLDGIDKERLNDYVNIAATSLLLRRETIGVVSSGNGLHLIIELKKPITDKKFFKENKHHYKAICKKIEVAIQAQDLPIKNVDPTVFEPRRILRLPRTINRKKDKPDTRAELVQVWNEPVEFNFSALSGIPTVAKNAQIPSELLRKYPKTDNVSILNECLFMKHAKENPNDLSEPQWYAALSIAARMQNGREISHEISKGHKHYSKDETDEKIDNALSASGPRTCENISALWDNCTSCPQFQKVKSPILIKSKDHIGTEHTGFHTIKYNQDGSFRATPNYDDLRKFFEKQQPYKVLGGSRMCQVWDTTQYKYRENVFIEEFAQTHFNPPATNNMVREFRDLICRTNVEEITWFEETTHKKMNFKNGTLDISSKGFFPHSSEIGFRHTLPYEYDPFATSPIFDAMLTKITGGDKDLENVLEEFMGYALSNDTCWAQKALVLIGEGANGKSTFMNCLRLMAGVGNYSSLTMTDIAKSEYNRQMMDGKLFNVAEETPNNSLLDSSHFKNLVSGGEIQVRSPYKEPYFIRNKAKLIFSCNELPDAQDTSFGYFRRLIIVPFNQKFTPKDADYDPHIDDKLAGEVAGIFNRAMNGYERLRKQQAFTESKVVQETVEDYKSYIDSVLAWCQDNLVVHTNGGYNENKADLMDMYANYAARMINMTEKPVTYKSFCCRVKKFLGSEDRFSRQREKNGEKKTWVQGVSIN